MKKCFKCGFSKPLSDYYKHGLMSDGHLGKCKECTKKDARKFYQKNVSNPDWIYKERERNRLKNKRLGYGIKYRPSKESKKEYIDRYRDKYPEKALCIIKSQSLKPKVKGNHLHHWSYNIDNAMDVIELTVSNHFIAHRHLIYDQERMMYRTKDGELLDTKERHLKYISQFFNNIH